jgi:adenosylhomocysteine nucleosidase
MPVDRRIDIDGVRCLTCRYAGRDYWLVLTGIGPEAAAGAARVVLNAHRAALAISAGFAGALMPTVALGEVIVATNIVPWKFDRVWSQAGAAISCEQTVQRAVQASASEIGATVRSGPVASVPLVVCRAAEKGTLSRLTGAIALDMESAAIGRVAQSFSVPFGVVRTISDLSDEDLPLDFNAFLKPWGWLRELGALIMTPSSVRGLIRLRRQSRLAAERLTAICSVSAANGFGLSPVSPTGSA